MPQQKKEFKTHNAQYGKYGGGTQAAKYFDKEGNEKPFKATKWAKLAKVKRVINSLAKGGNHE